MQLRDYYFNLPDALIARYPTAKRSDSRLLCLSSNQTTVLHKQFHEMIDLISPGDLLVFNNTKVMPARLIGKKMSGGRVEMLLEKMINNQHILAQLRISKSPRPGDILLFDQFRFEILGKNQQFYELCLLSSELTVIQVMNLIGQIPIPPYMQRNVEALDQERYQTIYAKALGSVASPTAGLHFDENLLQKLTNKEIEMVELTLHIGAGTFLPVRTDLIQEHRMHAEYFEISAEVCEKIQTTRKNGKRVIAVGTTTLRALETIAVINDFKEPYTGETRMFIYPGFVFHCADVLITNFHLPGSSLLMLVAAFAGFEKMMQAYQEAVQLAYRFYSYGDAMWVEKAI